MFYLSTSVFRLVEKQVDGPLLQIPALGFASCLVTFLQKLHDNEWREHWCR